MYSFKPITSVRVVIYDHTGGKLLPHIRQQLANYKQRWNQSIADKVFIVYQPEDIPANYPVIMASYIQLNLGLTETILLPSLNQLTHYHLRQLMLNIEYDYTDKLSVAMGWLDSLPDLIACDFETAPKLTKEEKAKLQLSPDLTHDQNLQLLATGLSHPSLVTVTHLSVASSESNSFVIILTDENRQPILDWLVDTDRKQVWHNAMFDLMHVFYHTNKFPKNVEDSQLMWATILNHTDSLQRKVGLKHLASTIYKEWAVSHDLFGLEHQYSIELIKYAAIDSQATMYLYNEALAHPDFQISMAPIDITEVFPIPEPKEFNPGRRHFYESVVKQLLYVMIRIRLNGLPLDLTKVDTLRDKLDTVLSDATIALNTNPLVKEFVSKESSNAKITFIKSTREKLKEYTEFLKPLDYSEVQGRSFLMHYLKEIYQFSYETNEFLPNGKDKWSINHVKQLSKQITEEPLYSILELILTKQLDPNEAICKEAALRLAITKAQFLKANQSLVEKIEEADTLSRIQFNPNSVPQKQALFQYLNIEPVAFSKDTNAPSWSREALEEIQPTLTGDRYNLVTELLNISEVKTTRTNFVENFTTYNINSRVYPNFKLWGTLSFRPSGGGDKPGTKSGFINSLNQPASGSPQAGIIKDCFTAPQGKILMASDLASLEDRVLANVANSKAKQDLILDGYDGHLYHACMYFRDQFLEILDLPSDTEHTTVVLAAMARKDEKEIKTLRSTSKGVTFGASYGAYPKKIAESIGCSIEQGEQIFDAYHNKLYPEITEYKETYVVPTVKEHGEIHMLLGASLKSDDVDKDVRTIYNATIQSFSVITLIAIAQMQKLIDKADLNNQVKIINTVYDAAYFEVDDDPIIIKWVNDNFIPLITQPYLLNERIPNDANCDLGYNLNHMIELQKQASIEQIEDTLVQLKEPKE